jgi:FtsP/CotA-like multicopper oxidase with cupredoxin domain
LVNGQAIPHNLRVHDAAFTVLDIDGRPPGARKDTVFVPPGTRIRWPSSPGHTPAPSTPLRFPCRLLAHEDAGMMGQLLLVQPQDAHRASATFLTASQALVTAPDLEPHPPGAHH